MTAIYAIKNKATNEFVVYNSKCAWTKKGNAKNAWVKANSWPFPGDWDNQDTHEIVNLGEYYYMYEDLCK